MGRHPHHFQTTPENAATVELFFFGRPVLDKHFIKVFVEKVMVFCSICGNEETAGKNFCSKCGTKLANTSVKERIERPPRTPKERSSMWYLAPILFGAIGGMVAYFIIRNDAPKMARNCLIIGFILFLIPVIIMAMFGYSF